MALSMLGMGTALPEHVMTQAEAIEMTRDFVCRTDREARIMRTIARKTGIQKRHLCVPHTIAKRWIPVLPRDLPSHEAEISCGPTTGERMQLYAEHAGTLAFQAAQVAMEDSRTMPEQITHVITVSCTGFQAPGVDVELIERLSLSPRTQRIHVGFMGCHGAINGLRAALGLCAGDDRSRVLVSAVELCSLHYCFSWNPERLFGNVLFADGAGAIVAAPENPDHLAWKLVDTASCLIPDSKDAITWRVGDYGFEMALSPAVPELIECHLGEWLEAWLHEHELAISDVGSWAIHPGGPKIVDAVETALSLKPDQTHASRAVLAEHGNMSSPTILFILERLRANNAPRPCVALGFGPGLFAEAMLIR